ncbi:GIY-YIG nuclease family protein [Mesotoga sp. B105.6.4]|uniref:GIY-YIG nuclease family protein n=1 Tax=Mesotoga sp. B105.6.4 TaxID=1582224 RepID=UPI000CCBDB3D|nr:GIY-YIG nuclease family protein [Mesotoga sp. B105.6.4]PNS40748.1 endonuclease [Mesotoga sp. B105.6.4]RAM60336.1 endonuclease [Mesotoga sp. SC_4PWA21]
MNSGFVYIMTNPSRTLFYVGVTNNLLRRVFEHKSRIVEGFTDKYNCVIVVYYEYHETIKEAIRREKQLKSWKKEWKLRLIKKMNPELRDLWEEIYSGSR